MYMMEYINVEPCDLIQIISKIKINVIYLELNVKATIQCKCYDDNNNLLNSYIFQLEDNEYQTWQTDEWLINYVCEKYGFVIKNNISV
jgi:hypothetical protein